MTQLSKVQHLSPYIQINPYKELLAKVNEFAGLLKNPGNSLCRIFLWRTFSSCSVSGREALKKSINAVRNYEQTPLSPGRFKENQTLSYSPGRCRQIDSLSFCPGPFRRIPLNITKNSKNMCMITWIPCSIPATRMIMCGDLFCPVDKNGTGGCCILFHAF